MILCSKRHLDGWLTQGWCGGRWTSLLPQTQLSLSKPAWAKQPAKERKEKKRPQLWHRNQAAVLVFFTELLYVFILLRLGKFWAWPSWRQWPPRPRRGWWRCPAMSWSWTLSSWCPPGDQTCRFPHTCRLSCQTGTGLRWSFKGAERAKENHASNTPLQTNSVPALQCNTHLHRQCVGHDSIHCTFSERVKVLVRTPHKLRFESVATFTVVFIHSQVQLHGQICRVKPENC